MTRTEQPSRAVFRQGEREQDRPIAREAGCLSDQGRVHLQATFIVGLRLIYGDDKLFSDKADGVCVGQFYLKPVALTFENG